MWQRLLLRQCAATKAANLQAVWCLAFCTKARNTFHTFTSPAAVHAADVFCFMLHRATPAKHAHAVKYEREPGRVTVHRLKLFPAGLAGRCNHVAILNKDEIEYERESRVLYDCPIFLNLRTATGSAHEQSGSPTPWNIVVAIRFESWLRTPATSPV